MDPRTLLAAGTRAQNAADHERAGRHEAAREDAIDAFRLLGEAIGLDRTALSLILDSARIAASLDYDLAKQTGAVRSEKPYIVAYGNGCERPCRTFAEAAELYRGQNGYALYNVDKQNGDDNFAGLTDEQRAEIGI